jgi:hypothetical protein
MTKRLPYLSALLCSMFLSLSGCGGGSSSNSGGPPPPPPANVQGQWHIIGHSTVSPNGYVLVETNLTQTGTDVFAGSSSTFLIQAVQDPTNANLIDLVGLGGACDNGALGYTSIQATISNQTQLSITLTDAGPLGTISTTGTATVSQSGAQLSLGTYSIPAGCGFPADSGTFTGIRIQPFAGSYAGMLLNSTGGTDAVIVSVSQTNYTLSVTGTDNGSSFTLSGSVVGGTFDVKGTISGVAVEYVGVYDPTGNDFLVYTTSLQFLGTLKAGTNPQAALGMIHLHE